MADFVGRNAELRSLQRALDQVRDGVSAQSPGRCVLVRGRRRVGKSRLLEQFCNLAATKLVPSLFFTASKQGTGELHLFAEEMVGSNLSGRDAFVGTSPQTWEATLRLLAAGIEDNTPTIIVIDEFPYLVADDETVEATFQKNWDRFLSKKPILLILVGSDLAMMEALNTHGRAFFQRGTELIVLPLSPSETAAIVGSPTAADAFDAYLLTGGLPLICADWPKGQSMSAFLETSLSEPTSALIVSAERVLAAEFPPEAQARAVLTEIGTGEMTFSKIARAAGGLQAASLTRSLDRLLSKWLVVRETPLSTSESKEARYRVADPYLQFWLRFVGPGMPEIERGRGDRVIARIERDWTTWRGKAIEPVIRTALTRLSATSGLPAGDAVGGFWTRSNSTEIDLIGADRSPIATRIAYAGTIKWHQNAPLDQADINRLAADVVKVPGADSSTPLIAVSRTGFPGTSGGGSTRRPRHVADGLGLNFCR